MCEPSIRNNKHFQTAVILRCQLININEQAPSEIGGVPALLLSISTYVLHLDWITMRLMCSGSSLRMWYKNGSDFSGKKVWDIINSTQLLSLSKIGAAVVRGQGSCALDPLMVTQSCQRWLRGWNAAASFTVRDGEDLLDGHVLACVRSWGGKETQTTAAGQQAIQDPHLFTSSLISTPISCLSEDILQLIMTRKIIATEMMKTLDLWPQGDLHPTSVVRREGICCWISAFPSCCVASGKREREADFCSLDSGWERGAVVTTQSVPYGEDMKLWGWVKWGKLFLRVCLTRQGHCGSSVMLQSNGL